MKKFLINKRNKHIWGVSLIEILVAMSILTVGLFMIYNIFPLGFAAAYRSKNRTIATQLAQQKMEELLTNSRVASCRSQVSGDCMVKPLEPNPNDPEYDLFDCRTLYGGPLENGKVRDATYCGIHSGPIESAASWSRFPSTSGDESFWYHIEVTRSTDPLQKYRSTANLVRVTITVRGPIADMNTWEELAQTTSSTGGLAHKRNMMPTEVFLTTFLSNKYIPSANIDNTYNATNFHNGVYDDGSGLPPPYYDHHESNDSKFNGRRIRVDNIRNFSMFSYTLNADERLDHGQVRYYESNTQDGTYLIPRRFMTTVRGGNYYGLDNVMIIRETKVFWNNKADSSQPPDPSQPIREIYVTQTNKVMKIETDTLLPNLETTEKIPGFLVLYEPVYVEPVDRTNIITPGANWMVSSHIDASIADRERLHGSDLYNANDLRYSLYSGEDNAYDGTYDTTVETPSGRKRHVFKIPYQGSASANTFNITRLRNTGDPPPDPDWFIGFGGPTTTSFLGDIDFACRKMHHTETIPDVPDDSDWEMDDVYFSPGWSGYEAYKDNRITAMINHRFPADGLPIYESTNTDDEIIDPPYFTEEDFDFRYVYKYYVVHLSNIKTPMK